jgi:predicted transcriptional regulator
MTQVNTVLGALKTGEELTAKQIAARYNVGNPHEVVRQLREQGYAVYLNTRVDSKGRVKQKYRLGTPSRAMVAAAYAATGTSAFA